MAHRTKRLLFIAFLVILAGALVRSPACPAPRSQPLQTEDWRTDYALILTNHREMSSVNRARDYAVSKGARIAILAPPNLMLGQIPRGVERELIGRHGIEAVIRDRADSPVIRRLDENRHPLVSFFNSIQATSATAERLPQLTVMPLVNDALERPRLDSRLYQNESDGRDVAAPPGEAPPAISQSMTGTVAVALFFVESDGTIDRDSYSWNATDEQETFNRALSGLSFWSSEAAKYGVSLTFTLFHYPSTDPVNRQGYEPVIHPQSQDYLWIEKIMANSGFLTGNRFDRVTAFNASLRLKAGTDSAYSVFVAYNPPPAPSSFADGYSAYAYLGGPYIQMLFINNGWGKEAFGICLRHEMGHIFWACDEYYQPGYGGCTSCGPCNPSGPRPTALNGNCESCNAAGVPCIMRYSSPSVCPYTAQQVGWPPEPLVASPPDGLLSIGKQGGPFSPASAEYTLENRGSLPLDWTASKAQPWLTVFPGGGTLTPGARATVTLSISEAAATLPAGLHEDLVTIDDNRGGGSPLTRSVKLDISPSDGPDGGEATPGPTGSSGGGGGGCFIATVAFGSDRAPQVMAFRIFRDRYLLASPLGRRLVAAYYRHSPALAGFNGLHPAARFGCRQALRPLAYAIGHPQVTKAGAGLVVLIVVVVSCRSVRRNPV